MQKAIEDILDLGGCGFGKEEGALQDGPLEEIAALLTAKRRNLMHDRPCSGRLSQHRHSLGIASESCDVLLHPLQREPLIEKTGVGSARGRDRRTGEPTKGTELGFS